MLFIYSYKSTHKSSPMQKTCLFVFLWFSFLLADAQTIMQQRWVLSYTDASIAAPLQLEDSSFVVTGYDDSSYVNRTLLVKLDKYGNTTFAQAYGSTDGADLLGMNVIQAADQGFFIVANYVLPGPPATLQKGTVIRLDASGNVVWAKSFTGRFMFALGMDIGELPDGGFVFCGMDNGSPPWKAFVAKLDAQGNLAWVKTMPDNSNNAHSNLFKKPNGNILVVWDSQENRDISVLELDAAGNTVWGKAYQCGGMYHWAQCINTDEQGNILLAGIGMHNTPMAPYNGQPTITKLDPSGNILWRKKYNATWGIAEPLSIAQDHNGDYVLSLEPENVTATAYATYPRTIMKVNSNGNPVSLRHSMDNYMVFRDKMKLTYDQGMIGMGAYNPGSGNRSTVIKSGGNNEVPCYTDNFSTLVDSTYTVTSIAALPLNNSTLSISNLPIYITTPAYTVTKLCSDSALVTIENTNAISEHTASPLSFDIAPNPSNNSPHIKLMLSEAMQVKVNITNIIGMSIGTFNFDLMPGVHELDLPVKAAPGTYRITVASNELFSVKQLIIVE